MNKNELVSAIKQARGCTQGRNPRTGELVPIHPRTSVKFHPGKFLLEALTKQE